MINNYSEELESILSRIDTEYHIAKKAVNRPKWPQLMIEVRGQPLFFAVTYREGKRFRRLINKDSERIYRLAHKAYIKEYARRLKANREILAKAEKQLLPLDYRSMLADLPKHFDLLDPVLVKEPHKSAGKFFYPNPSRDVAPIEAMLEFSGTDVWEWAAAPYCENTDHPEHKTHLTRSGLYCRSKSEALIFEIYMSLGLPFHYDETVTIGGQWISPDWKGKDRNSVN